MRRRRRAHEHAGYYRRRLAGAARLVPPFDTAGLFGGAAFDDVWPRDIRLADGSPSLHNCCAGRVPRFHAGDLGAAAPVAAWQRPAAPAARPDSRRQRARRVRLLPGDARLRAARLDRYVASLNVPAATYSGWTKRRQDGVLGERLQRVRAPDGRQPLSDQGHEQRLPGVEHPADCGRVRPDEAPRRGAQRDARSRSRRPSSPSSRSRACRSRSAAAPSAAAGCAARPTPRRACPSSSNRIQKEFVTKQRTAQGRPRSPASCRRAPIVSWHEAEFVAAYAGKAGAKFARARRSNGRSSRSSRRTSCRSRRSWSTKNRFKVTFQEFDWRLNDLTGGRID